MDGAERSRGRLYVVLAAALVLVAAALWLPTWWEAREYRQAEAMTGVGSEILAGTLAEARRNVESGKTSDAVTAAIGRPSVSVRTEGSSSHEKWTYYYADGTMTINITDGAVVRVSTDFRPPVIPTSRRSE